MEEKNNGNDACVHACLHIDLEEKKTENLIRISIVSFIMIVVLE